jgi:histone deacetylase 1/2
LLGKGAELSDALPPTDYIEYFRPDYRLHLTPAAMENLNTRTYLERCTAALLESLRGLDTAPSVPFDAVVPSLAERRAMDGTVADSEADARPDHRSERDPSRREHAAEFDEDESGGALGAASASREVEEEEDASEVLDSAMAAAKELVPNAAPVRYLLDPDRSPVDDDEDDEDDDDDDGDDDDEDEEGDESEREGGRDDAHDDARDVAGERGMDADD